MRALESVRLCLQSMSARQLARRGPQTMEPT